MKTVLLCDNNNDQINSISELCTLKGNYMQCICTIQCSLNTLIYMVKFSVGMIMVHCKILGLGC